MERKNVESIAYRFGQDRLPLQRFIGWAPWEDAPLRQELMRQVAVQLGHADGVLVFDPSSFPKSGPESVGVARQWCGRLGKVDNCQVAVYLGYVSGAGHTLVDMRLYLPKAWTTDKARLDKAGVPADHRGYRSRHQLALDMLQARGPWLPHRWIAGDDEMGRPYWFRRRLDRLGERYMLAVPGNTLVRDLETAPRAASGRGRRPQRPWQRLDQWSASLAEDTWTTATCAMVRKARWSSRWSSDGWWRARLSVRRGIRRWPWWCAIGIETSRRWCTSTFTSPMALPRHHWPNLHGCLRPNIALKNACSAARVRPAWRIMRYAIGRAGIIIKRCR